MEASSLTFAGASPATSTRGQTQPVADDGTGKRPCRVPIKKAAIADVHAPSVSLPLRFILTGMLSLFVGIVWLAVRPDILATYHYNQYVIAVTHLLVLGWIGSVIMGAMYQLVPVALETRLHSERLARWHFALHTVGFIGMVAMFWIWDMKQVGHFGSAFGLGVGLFVYNLGRTLMRIPRWNVIAAGIASALAWLFLTTMAGLFLASAKCWPQISPFNPIAAMHAHAHLGVVGFFVMMLVAVSYKLVPMFTLGELQSSQRAGWAIALLNAGLFGLFVTILVGSAWKLAFALVIIAALALYGWEIIAILRARKRRSLDWGLKHFLTAIGLLLPLSILAVVLCWPGLPMTALTTQLENVYGFVAIIGVITFAIVGMLYKVVPFLVWYASYSKQIGRRPVPSLGGLYSVRLQAVGYALFVTGLLTTGVAIALGHERCVQWTCALLAGSLLVFAVNMGMILSHLFRPRTQGAPTHLTPTSTLS
jgi:hypothetical protein